MRLEKTIKDFYKRLQEAYPLLKGWQVEIVANTSLHGFRHGGYCNRKRKVLEVAPGKLMSEIDAKVVTLHESIHVLTGGSHGREFTIAYQKALKRWFAGKYVMTLGPNGEYRCLFAVGSRLKHK